VREDGARGLPPIGTGVARAAHENTPGNFCIKVLHPGELASCLHIGAARVGGVSRLGGAWRDRLRYEQKEDLLLW